MALVNYGVVSPSLTLTVQMELSDADSERIVAYLMAATPYGSVTENVVSEAPDASWTPGEDQTEADRPMLQTQAWVTRPATPEETAANYARSVLASLLSATVAHEKAAAAAAASAAISDIQPIA